MVAFLTKTINRLTEDPPNYINPGSSAISSISEDPRKIVFLLCIVRTFARDG